MGEAKYGEMIIKLAQATCRIWPVYPPESLYVGLSALDFEAHRTWGCAPGWYISGLRPFSQRLSRLPEQA